MYEEITIRKHVDWKRLLIRIAILLLVVFILCALIMNPNRSRAETPYTNINKSMLNAGKIYYTDEKLPTRIGRSNKITLQDLINEKLIKANDYEKNNCDLNNSFVKITKVNDKEFSIYSFLSCKKATDTVADTITIKVDNSNNNTYNTNVNTTEATEEGFSIQVIE